MTPTIYKEMKLIRVNSSTLELVQLAHTNLHNMAFISP